ncbi:MAG: ketoacyl-ACP synthase III [Bdellovibrio sp.]|nr:MAG: ketoacyl-ACP synthase III [Bdellovibrio sp.]
MKSFYRVRIAGTGSYLPEKLLSNKDLEKMVETSDEWIRERTGIVNRHIASDNEATSDLALKASLKALEEAQISPKELDLILVATVSPDQIMPSTACELQAKLDARHCMAFDLSAACSGFLYGLSIANEFIATGRYKNILVVGAEVLHHFVDYTKRETCILFGDAAGAAVLTAAKDYEESCIYSHHMAANGTLADLLILPAGGSKMPCSEEVLKERLNYVRMKGREIFKHAVRTMTDRCQEALDANQMQLSDIDWIIPHQANTRIIEAVAKSLKAPLEKFIITIEDMGNTSAATIPVSFDMAIRDGRIQRGQNILMTAFGAGLTSGSVLMRY